MTITLRQESAAGANTKNSSLTYAELDNTIIDLLQNKIIPLQVNADTGTVTVGQAQQNGVFTIQGSTGLNTTVTEDSAGNANLTISLDQVIGSNLNVTIYAKATENLSAGDVVQFAGAQGDHLLVKKAVIDDSADAFISEYIVGMVASPMSTNDFGYIVTQGQITHSTLNTNAFAPGTILFYDPTTSGGVTATEPTAPNPKVKVAAVLKQNVADGILLVRPTFSRRMNDIEDVSTSAASNNDYLVYNSANSVWQHQGLDISHDTSPQLGGALDVNNQSIVSTSNADILITPDGTGKVVIDGLNYPTSDGTAGQFLRTDGFNNLTFADVDIPNITAGDNISITSPDSGGAISIALRNPLNQPVVAGDQIISQVVLKDYAETVYQLSYAATITPDVANGNVQEITLTGGVTFAGFTSPLDGQSITLIIHQDGTGGRTFTEGLDSANRMLFAGGTSTLSPAGNATDIMSIFYASGVYYASLSTNFS